jgi:hypothetical protein
MPHVTHSTGVPIATHLPNLNIKRKLEAGTLTNGEGLVPLATSSPKANHLY